MARAVRIGITGTHSTGKTTLMRRIELELRAGGTPVVRTGGLAKRAAALGMPKMEQHTALSTEWIITAGIADELAATVNAAVVLADRAAPDALAYYTAALEHRGEEPDPDTLQRLKLLLDTVGSSYDLLFATVLDRTEPVTKNYDPGYRELVDRHVHQLLAEMSLDHFPVTNDDTSRDAAFQLALRTIGGTADPMP